MKRYFAYILLALAILVSIWTMSLDTIFAGVQAIPGSDQIRPLSVGVAQGSNTLEKLQYGGLRVLHTAKVIISFLAVIWLVYSGIQMIIAMGNEKDIAAQKNQLWYSVVAFLFVNIPGEIYATFSKKEVSNATRNPADTFTDVPQSGSNIFVNFFNWHATVEQGVLSFIRVGIIAAAIFLFTLAGFRLITSGGDDERKKQAKWQFLYGVLGLIFLAVIEGWVQVVYTGDIGKGQGIFAQLSNLALFFAGPTAIFFLLLGGYYMITSAGEEEKAKKGKTIVVNTFIAVIILLASYAFLKDLADFSF